MIELNRLFCWRLCGRWIEVGFPGHSTCLHVAMCFASHEIVHCSARGRADAEATDYGK